MGERKVQAKYYPPDFDPSNLPRVRKKRDVDDAVRFMLPMSVRCETCGEFMGTGLKFNARKSHTGDDYLGIRIWRFSMKCKGCPATFSIRTDPKNSDYACEAGVRRNYEPWRDAKRAQAEADDERTRQDQDAIQALENKTLDAKQQMDELDKLDEIKAVNSKRGRVNVDDLLAQYEDALEQKDKEDQEKNLKFADGNGLLSQSDEAIIEKQALLAIQTAGNNEHAGIADKQHPNRPNDVTIREKQKSSNPPKPKKKAPPSIIGAMLTPTIKVKKKITKPNFNPAPAAKAIPTPRHKQKPTSASVPAPKSSPVLAETLAPTPCPPKNDALSRTSEATKTPTPSSLVGYDDVDSSSSSCDEH